MKQNDREIARHALNQANLSIVKLESVKTLRTKKNILKPLFDKMELTERSISQTEADIRKEEAKFSGHDYLHLASLRDELASHKERLARQVQNFERLTFPCPNTTPEDITPLRTAELINSLVQGI